MTAQPPTKVSASATVAGMNMVIIMSGGPRLDRMTSTQATAAIMSRMIEVTTDVRPRKGGRVTRDADICCWAGTMDAVYVGCGDEATDRGLRRQRGRGRSSHAVQIGRAHV